MISIVIPAYNCEKWIARSIESAISQNYVSEIIVVDDGSTDKTIEVARRYLTSTKMKVIHHKNRANKGIANTRNLGINHATSEWISFLDADDYYFDNRFDKTVSKILSGHSIRAISEPVVVRFQNNMTTLEWKELYGKTTLNVPYVEHKQMFEAYFDGKSHFGLHTNGFTIRCSLLKNIGMFDNRFSASEDIHLWYRLLLLDEVWSTYSEAPVACYFRHENNQGMKDKISAMINQSRVLLDLIKWAKNKNICKSRIDMMFDKNEKLWYALFNYYLLSKESKRKMAVKKMILFLMFNPRLLYDKKLIRDLFWIFIRNLEMGRNI